MVRFLKAQGFVEDRQSGSHLTLWHEELGSAESELEAIKRPRAFSGGL
ncbi:MAG: type II toxin-antitoxin system HicA family toxin [Thermodesulfobacteriota bacterium]